MINNNDNVLYEPSSGKEITKEIFSFLWSEETYNHISYTKHSSASKPSLSENNKDNNFDFYRDENKLGSKEICGVEETDYPGYYVYSIKILRDKKSYNDFVFSDTVLNKGVLDLNQVSMDEFFLDVESALIGSVPNQTKNGNYTIYGTNNSGNTFKAYISKNDKGKWFLNRVYPVLKTKHDKKERIM